MTQEFGYAAFGVNMIINYVNPGLPGRRDHVSEWDVPS